MPAISIKTSAPLDMAVKTAIKQSLGQIIAIVPRKSERWLMVLFENVDDIYLGTGQLSICRSWWPLWRYCLIQYVRIKELPFFHFAAKVM